MNFGRVLGNVRRNAELYCCCFCNLWWVALLFARKEEGESHLGHVGLEGNRHGWVDGLVGHGNKGTIGHVRKQKRKKKNLVDFII
jgi:hypothetical protein